MKRWQSILAIGGASAGMLIGGLVAGTPADAAPYPNYHHDGARPAVRQRMDDNRDRQVAHRQWVAAHWDHDNFGHRVWRQGYWR